MEIAVLSHSSVPVYTKYFYKTVYDITSAVADPGFPVGGAWTS